MASLNRYYPLISAFICEHLIPGTYEYDYPTTLDDLQDTLRQHLDEEVSTMNGTDWMTYLNEFGVHEAYQAYHDSYGQVPEYQGAIIYHVIWEVYELRHAIHDIDKYNEERVQWLNAQL